MARHILPALAFAAALSVAAVPGMAHQPADGMGPDRERMHDRFERMDHMMRNGTAESGPARHRTMREHMDLMHEQMQDMHAMMRGHGGMMMDGAGPGAGSGAGHMQDRMSERGMNRGGDPDSRLDSMQERMDYMQQMMEQMLEQQDMMLRNRSE